MKNILVLTSTFSRWEKDTIPVFVNELSHRLAKNNNVVVLAPYVKGAAKHEFIGDLQVYRFQYWFNGTSVLADGNAILPNLKRNKWLWLQVPFFLFVEIFMAHKLARRHKIDVIHAHWIIPQCIAAVVAVFFLWRKPSIVGTIHGSDIFGLQFFNRLKRFVWNRMQGLTVVSTAIQNEVIRIGSNKTLSIDVIPMGVDTQLFSPDKYNENLLKQYKIRGPLLLYVGRFSEQKGIRYLLEAMPEILKKEPSATLLLIGEGQEGERLKELTHSLDLPAERVQFLGSLQNETLPDFYAIADIFIGPSIQTASGEREGSGITFIEAMSCGATVIATDLQNFKDYIIHGTNGYIVQQKNAGAIAQQVLDIASNPADDIGKHARQYVIDHYDWNTIAERYNGYLSSC